MVYYGLICKMVNTKFSIINNTDYQYIAHFVADVVRELHTSQRMAE